MAESVTSMPGGVVLEHYTPRHFDLEILGWSSPSIPTSQPLKCRRLNSAHQSDTP